MQQPGTPGQVHPCIVTTTIPHHPTFLLFPTPLGGISFPTDTASKSCKIWWAMLRLHGFVQPYTPHPEKKGLVWGKLSHLWRSKVWVCTVLEDLVFPWHSPNSNSRWKAKEGMPCYSLRRRCSRKWSYRCEGQFPCFSGQQSLTKSLWFSESSDPCLSMRSLHITFPMLSLATPSNSC